MSEAKDDILIYCQARQVSMTDHWFEYATSDHFWIDWRFKIFKKMISPLKNRIKKAIEIGAGNGAFRQDVENNLGIVTDAADLNATALEQCPKGMGKRMIFDVLSTPQELINSYDAVFLMDVIEHIEDDVEFLRSASSLIHKDGFLAINVPAMPFLMSRYDEVQGHYRRYTNDLLQQTINKASLKVIDMRYWGCFMVPILTVRRFILMLYKSEKEIVSIGFQPPGYISGKILSLIGRIERAITMRWPFGSSVMCVAQKI